jgi:hypothetical protein
MRTGSRQLNTLLIGVIKMRNMLRIMPFGVCSAMHLGDGTVLYFAELELTL